MDYFYLSLSQTGLDFCVVIKEILLYVAVHNNVSYKNQFLSRRLRQQERLSASIYCPSVRLSVCLFVCLFVCLHMTFQRTHYWTPKIQDG